ncbi:hypothetical protein HYW74_01650 [Candidatus Pacearchaeota archaeon]|nr:hypothetical protein [Candidatus Pacearchaeota archaeon]
MSNTSNYNELAKQFKKFSEKLALSSKKQFSGSTPPEIFVGRKDYPKVYTGILSPIQKGDTESFSSPEAWFRKQASIQEILDYRQKLIYSRFKTNVKAPYNNKMVSALNQVAMSSKSLSAEFSLHKPPRFSIIKEPSIPIIGNPAPLKSIKLQENPKIHTKVDYTTGDNRLKASEAIKILYKNQIEISNITKILSAGLLGLKNNRKMVPTRWAITATDDTLSKDMLKKIREFNEINEILVFHGEYLGNHYEILLLPSKFEFEVIEISSKSLDKNNLGVWQDYEGFYGRKTYADDVTGAYYVNRLALCEYLTQIKKQCSCIFFREVKPSYTSPLGVGILRELSRSAFQKQPEKFQSIQEAINHIQTRLTIPVSLYTNKSKILADYGKQRRLSQWS